MMSHKRGQDYSHRDQTRAIAARWIFPVGSPPIHGGWILLRGDEVVDVARGHPPAGAQDLGDVALFPALVNAHTHLEFSDLKQPIGDPGIALSDWIGRVIARRRDRPDGQNAQAIGQGMRESQAAGVRLVGEITTPPTHYPPKPVPELVCFGEVIGLDETRGQERLRACLDHQTQTASAAWSPHAPYSTAWDLIEFCIAAAVRTQKPLAMHVAESAEERELLQTGTGPLADQLRALGVWRDGHFPWTGSPFATLLDRMSIAPRVLLIHGNDFSDEEIHKIAKHPQMTVVYCPRTHAFFGHPRHPVDRMHAAGVRVALGTDSRASNPDLHLWKEVQWLINHRVDLDPMLILQMATLSGAEALGRSELGRFAPGTSPGILAVSTTATSVDGVAEAMQSRLPRWVE